MPHTLPLWLFLVLSANHQLYTGKNFWNFTNFCLFYIFFPSIISVKSFSNRRKKFLFQSLFPASRPWNPGSTSRNLCIFPVYIHAILSDILFPRNENRYLCIFSGKKLQDICFGSHFSSIWRFIVMQVSSGSYTKFSAQFFKPRLFFFLYCFWQIIHAMMNDIRILQNLIHWSIRNQLDRKSVV